MTLLQCRMPWRKRHRVLDWLTLRQDRVRITSPDQSKYKCRFRKGRAGRCEIHDSFLVTGSLDRRLQNGDVSRFLDTGDALGVAERRKEIKYWATVITISQQGRELLKLAFGTGCCWISQMQEVAKGRIPSAGHYQESRSYKTMT